MEKKGSIFLISPIKLSDFNISKTFERLAEKCGSKKKAFELAVIDAGKKYLTEGRAVPVSEKNKKMLFGDFVVSIETYAKFYDLYAQTGVDTINISEFKRYVFDIMLKRMSKNKTLDPNRGKILNTETVMFKNFYIDFKTYQRFLDLCMDWHFMKKTDVKRYIIESYIKGDI